MKKIITTAILAAMLTATFAGCDNNNSSVNSDNSVSDVQSSTESNNTESTDSDASSTPEAESKTAAERLSAMFNAFPQFFSATEGMAMVACGPDLEAMNEVFPMEGDTPTHCIYEMGDGETGLTMLGIENLDVADLEDFIVAAPMMSAQLKQFIIVKPVEGKEETVKAAMDAFAESAKEGRRGDYPAWEEERAGTTIGETADGYIYVVVAAEGAEMGAAIENA